VILAGGGVRGLCFELALLPIGGWGLV
jgi:hypothetical protein